MSQEVVDGEKQISGSNTTKRGYPIVSSGTLVDCAHCDEVHEANWRDGEVGVNIPGGHKRHHHYTCPETGKMFAGEKGSRR